MKKTFKSSLLQQKTVCTVPDGPPKRIPYQQKLVNAGLSLSTGVIVIARFVGWTKVPKGIYPIIQLFLLCQAQYCIVLRSKYVCCLCLVVCRPINSLFIDHHRTQKDIFNSDEFQEKFSIPFKLGHFN